MARLGPARLCRSCYAPIAWCITAGTSGGKSMPVDVDPVEDGNIVVDERPGGLVATVLPVGQATLDDRPRYVSHFATCPNADQHRRPR